MFRPFAVVLAASLIVGLSAHPSMYQCDATCLLKKKAGDDFTAMSAGPSFKSGSAANDCVVTSNIPKSGYKSGSTYDITVTSQQSLKYKVAASEGSFATSSGTVVNGAASTKTTTYKWTA